MPFLGRWVSQYYRAIFLDISATNWSADSNVYHKADCPELGNNIIEFDSAEQAQNAGGVSCENCNPWVIISFLNCKATYHNPFPLDFSI